MSEKATTAVPQSPPPGAGFLTSRDGHQSLSERAPARLTRWLARAPGPVFVGYAAGAAFATYFCMYAFRKPFDAATFDGLKFLGTWIDLKTALVVGQILGYTVSKFLGARVCAEVGGGRRATVLVVLVAVAEAALVAFAIVPDPLKPLAMFVNGLPLGMVWGLVIRFLEGRRASEVLMIGLSCSYILSSGVVKDVGRELLRAGVSEWWMPALAGLLFLPAFLLAVWLLNRLPAPGAADVAARSVRTPMDRAQRRAFLLACGAGLAPLLVAYFLLTAYRDFRDHYGREVFRALGYDDTPAVFSRSEVWAAFGVMAALAGLNLVRGHRRALVGLFGVVAAGYLLVGAATLLFRAGHLSGLAWMSAIGLGLYVAYVPIGSILFERLMAATRFAGTAVFAIQLADAVGYTGSVLVQLTRDLAFGGLDRLGFLLAYSYVVSTLGAGLIAVSGVLLLRRSSPRRPEEPALITP
jgi:hypothetical protein